MKLKHHTVALIILVVFASMISISKASGYWKTESSKVPILLAEGVFAGAYDPNDIRGSYTFEDVSSLFDIPIETLGEAFNIPPEYELKSFQNKNLESLYFFNNDIEIGNGSVKLFTAFYSGLPYDYQLSGDYLLESAVNILIEGDRINEEQWAYLQEHTAVQMQNASQSLSDEAHNSDVDSELVIKGKTLFQEVLDIGLAKDDIESILGIEMGHPLKEIRAYCQENNLEFSEVKAKLQALVDSQ